MTHRAMSPLLPLIARRIIPTIRATFVLMSMLFALLPPGAWSITVHSAHIQIVNSIGDFPAGSVTDCTMAITGCSLRDALFAAANGDTIALAFNTPGTVMLTNGQLTINKSVTIQGAGLLTVDGNHASRVFEVDTGAVEMDGLTITHGQVSNIGAGVLVTSGSLMLVGCTVSGNTVSGSGGLTAGAGIYTQANLTVTNTTISSNTVTNTSTGTAHQIVAGGAITVTGGTTTITNSSIADNVVQLTGTDAAAEMSGGGIFNEATLHLTGSTVSGNRVSGDVGLKLGGGLVNLGTMTITNSTIANNVAGNTLSGSGGGGIDISGGTLTVTSSTITGNVSGVGGALYSGSGSVSFMSSLIARNTDTFAQPDIAADVTSNSSNNLIGDGSGLSGIGNGTNGNQIGTAGSPIDPQLDPAGLQANGSGGPKTVALLHNSPAIEAGGVCTGGVTTDERGQPRVGNCDIGAYEYQPVTPTANNAIAPVAGGNVTFIGTGFQTGSQLTVNGTTITAPAGAVSRDGTHLTLAVAAHTAGTVPFAIANPGSGHLVVANLTYGLPQVQPTPRATVGSSNVATPVPVTHSAGSANAGTIAPQPVRHS